MLKTEVVGRKESMELRGALTTMNGGGVLDQVFASRPCLFKQTPCFKSWHCSTWNLNFKRDFQFQALEHSKRFHSKSI